MCQWQTLNRRVTVRRRSLTCAASSALARSQSSCDFSKRRVSAWEHSSVSRNSSRFISDFRRFSAAMSYRTSIHANASKLKREEMWACQDHEMRSKHKCFLVYILDLQKDAEDDRWVLDCAPPDLNVLSFLALWQHWCSIEYTLLFTHALATMCHPID